MPSLKDISIIFRLSAQFDEFFIAKSLKKSRAMQIIRHWLKQADQYCPRLQRLSIKVDIAGHHDPYFVFDCVRHQQNQSKKWVVQIWREYASRGELSVETRHMVWIANFEIVT